VRAVRRHPDFEADYVELLEWLVDLGARARIVQLSSGLHEVVRMLAVFPAAGPRMAERGTVVLRKLLFPQGPFVAWYLHDAEDPGGDLWLVRLFHARQRRPDPGRWLRGSRGNPGSPLK
jgi:plasmid stabilization system protein ParE